MKVENGIYTPSGVLVGQAITLPNGELAIKVKRSHRRNYDVITVPELLEQIEKLTH